MLHVLLKAVDEFISYYDIGLGTGCPELCCMVGETQGIDGNFGLETWMTCSRCLSTYWLGHQSFISDFDEPLNFEPQLICEALKNWGSCISLIAHFFIYINFKTSLIPAFCPACFKKCRLQNCVVSASIYSMRPCFHKYTPSSTNSVYIL